MRISDWSSDVCSSDLLVLAPRFSGRRGAQYQHCQPLCRKGSLYLCPRRRVQGHCARGILRANGRRRLEEHTSELQSLLRTSYAVFCLKKKTCQKYLTIHCKHVFRINETDSNQRK